MTTFDIARCQREIARCQLSLRDPGATANSRELSRKMIQRFRTAIKMLREGQSAEAAYRYVQTGDSSRC